MLKITAMALAFIFSSQVLAGGTVPVIQINGLFDAPPTVRSPSESPQRGVPGTVPDMIELHIFSSGQLAFCSIVIENFGSLPAPPIQLPVVDVFADSYYYITNGPGFFESYFGFAENLEEPFVLTGNDSVSLFCNGMLVDVFGLSPPPSSPNPFEYTNGWVHKKAGAPPPPVRSKAPSPVFDPMGWTYSGTGANLGCLNNATCPASGFYEIGTLPVELENFSVE